MKSKVEEMAEDHLLEVISTDHGEKHSLVSGCRKDFIQGARALLELIEKKKFTCIVSIHGKREVVAIDDIKSFFVAVQKKDR